jgi:hypothetical protein
MTPPASPHPRTPGPSHQYVRVLVVWVVVLVSLYAFQEFFS